MIGDLNWLDLQSLWSQSFMIGIGFIGSLFSRTIVILATNEETKRNGRRWAVLIAENCVTKKFLKIHSKSPKRPSNILEAFTLLDHLSLLGGRLKSSVDYWRFRVKMYRKRIHLFSLFELQKFEAARKFSKKAHTSGPPSVPRHFPRQAI